MEGTKVLGTAALGLDVSTNLTPSIIGLRVGQEYWRRGIATELLETSVSVATELGHQRLFISTSVLGGLLKRMGWQDMGEVRFLNDEYGTVYVREL